jgi:hypothetical protein
MSREMEKIKKEKVVIEFTIIYYQICGRTEENKNVPKHCS